MRLSFAYFLLAPIAPLLGWGPITHIYLHKKMMDELDGNGPEGILTTDNDKQIFINAGNIADLIKANQLRYKERYYEYAHNTIPTKFEGQPVLGEKLWEANKRLGRHDGLIYSLGWICHQVADQFPHRFPTNGFEGFVNARHFFGSYYPEDEEDWSEPTRELRNDLISTDHWLAEIFTDLLCLSEEADFFRTYKINLDFGDYPEMEKVTSEVIDKYYDDLYPAVKYFIPLKPDVLKRVFRYYHTMISVFMDMYFHFYDALGKEGVLRFVYGYEPLKDIKRMLDFSMEAIRDTIAKPVGGWVPEKYKSPDPGPVKFSVYSYENYDGPERYDFGFRRGLIPWIAGVFAGNQLLNELGRLFADHLDTWGLIKPVMEIASKRHRSGLNLTAFFICEMDTMDEPSIDKLIRMAAKRFKLNEKGD